MLLGALVMAPMHLANATGALSDEGRVRLWRLWNLWYDLRARARKSLVAADGP